ncbi:MAG: hypothetical protein AAFU66_07170 [Pseudomonadota bacterium]
MKTTTRKLSGPSKERFFKRFFKDEPGVSDDLADQLAKKSSTTFSSVRVRRSANTPVLPQRPVNQKSPPKKVPQRVENASTDVEGMQPTATLDNATATPSPQLDEAIAETASASTPLAEPQLETEPEDFDPYAFGLVPTMQREGEAGLVTRLNAIKRPENLRAMAKAQQIVLPRELRTGNETADTLRDAIVIAVSKRIVDRRSAASEV